ncbi:MULTISPECIES: class I SAM-dependent methyltransferase [Virgibacillus]|uniref:Class I SAM-dependent methyltransferase n=1 Tax=Virgibacillus salarius TaxID=447199 RepID=A0A941DR24_9BACI|nr:MULTISPECIES: class I SAM-dependent methyltransferase [Virgibacillus]MBR7795065.1 class I SAM-dependent methyltransferase [Virgibacillus salarius]MDY7043136.1 class I SAM-dependent methyltransferase [Virgibacillus sp. M23]NAZ07782.1 methyltransferase domain-containing protein [Agaribacter marinus]
MNFHELEHKEMYATREADSSWINIVTTLMNQPASRIRAADIGCGGGIYAKALAEMGIPTVIGIDFSDVMLTAAKQNCQNYSQLSFKKGNAYSTGLQESSVDLVLQRALIHHLKDLPACFREAYRILQKDGVYLIQDRTISDCLRDGDTKHIRGWLYSLFPRLINYEEKRRFSSDVIINSLKDAGFKDIEELQLKETRKIYPSKELLFTDIRRRNGKSILYQLSDQEIEKFISYLNTTLKTAGEITEVDYWTIWKAVK